MGLSQLPDDLRNFPMNYDTCFNFIRLLIQAILIPLGIGRTPCYHPKLELHIYSIQYIGGRLNNICVLFLLERAKLYEKDTEEEREELFFC